MKNIQWMFSSYKDLMTFPKEVIQEIGFALYMAQKGEHYTKTKPFKGWGSGIYEIALSYNKNAYRTIYAVNLDKNLYVVHCFQKKSKHGIKTPKEEVDIIRQRLQYLKITIGS